MTNKKCKCICHKTKADNCMMCNCRKKQRWLDRINKWFVDIGQTTQKGKYDR